MPGDGQGPAGLETSVRSLLDDGEALGLRLLAGAGGLDRPLTVAAVARPAREMGRDVQAPPGAVVLLGPEDLAWLRVRSEDEQRAVLESRLAPPPPAVIVCRGIYPPDSLLAVAERLGIPLFITRRPTGEVEHALTERLRRWLCPTERVHGVLVQVHNLGVLLLGASGIGKSETALELVLRGHRLVADDVVLLQRAGPALLGEGPELFQHHLEIRGLGVLHAADLFGHAAVLEKTAVHLVIELVGADEAIGVDRTGLVEPTWECLGVRLPLVRLPVRPGRNLALLIEVAARNQILKRRGIHSARRFAERLESRLREQEPDEG
ncbi:MAG: HPr(Ser) kinase/phosphatase [Deltaproteobacteria bacterium]|nr:MAG: HPr(Ser) kinase/phosphatase [Deltaproteobacteria bacterium]